MLSLRLALSGLLGAPLLALASPDLFLAKPGSQNHHRRHHGHIVHHPRPKHHPHRATTSGFIVRQATSSISARSSTSTTPARSSTSVVSTASSVGPVSARPPSLVSAAAAPPATTPVNPYLGNWNLSLIGNSGVSAQQLAVVDENHAIIYDKVETNVLQVDGHPAYGAIYRFSDNFVRPLHVNTNSFCAGGTFLANGTMLSIGGNAVQLPQQFNDSEGRQSIRFFDPCPTTETCDVYDNPAIRYLRAPRWYPSTMRFFDGSAFIVGGMNDQGYSNTPALNQPNFEYYPPKSLSFASTNGLINSPFLVDTLNANAFAIIFALPDSEIFFAANQQAMIYNPYTNVEARLPNIPNGVRLSYPMAGAGVLLQLIPSNSYTPTVLLCGGSNVSDAVGANTNVTLVSSQSPASNQCARMALNRQGIAAGWEVETMPYKRTMHNLIMMPDGQVLIINGAQTGVSGYGTVRDAVGPNSNADNPAFQPVLYNPAAPHGLRFSTSGIPASTIPRMYHSTATLRPSGDIMIAGSAPNLYATTGPGIRYPTEFRVESLSPPYMAMPRPTLVAFPSRIPHASTFNLTVTLPTSLLGASLTVNLLDLGFATHGLSMNSRNVLLIVNSGSPATGLTVSLNVTSPPHPGAWPAGPGWLYVLANGVPSAGRKTIIGSGVVGRN